MAEVAAVHASALRGISKDPQQSIRLVKGLGVEGDVHYGPTVRHQSRMITQAGQPNLRQVHLIAAEQIADLTARGFNVTPGIMGENVTTAGLDLHGLAPGARLTLGNEAEIEVTGLRNPCKQLDGLIPGLMAAVLDRSIEGELIRRGGIMAVVLRAGPVRPGDGITISDPGRVGTVLDPV